MGKEEMEEVRLLSETVKLLTYLSHRVMLYKYNLSLVYPFFLFGGVFAAVTMIVVGIRYGSVGAMLTALVISLIVAGLLSTYMYYRVFAHAVRMMGKELKVSGAELKRALAVISTLVFPVVYAILVATGVQDWRVYATAWYMALGIYLILYDALVISKPRSLGLVKSKPHLYSGVALLVTYPLIVLAFIHGLIEDPMVPVVAMGLCLLIYMLAGFHALISAERVFEE